MRFVVALLHLVSVLERIEPLLVSLAVGSPAATSLATASSWRPSARPAQRRPAPLHPHARECSSASCHRVTLSLSPDDEMH
eukprot:scaffold44733_cov76-Phaeocystis_antarctica.AAC.1